MKYVFPLATALFLFVGCSMFEARQPTQPPVPPKTLAVPVGENWQVIEEAPHLTSQPNQPPPFQTGRSLEPAGSQGPPITSKDKPKLEQKPKPE